MPNPVFRLAIWKKHLPHTIPLAEDVDLERLATEFEFSGGQIAVVVKNAAMTAAIRGDEVRMDDLLIACKTEEKGAFDSDGVARKRPVGFCS